MVVWRIRGKIGLRTVLCGTVYDSTVVHSDTHAHMNSCLVDCWFWFSLDLGLLFVFCILLCCLVLL